MADSSIDLSMGIGFRVVYAGTYEGLEDLQGVWEFGFRAVSVLDGLCVLDFGVSRLRSALGL